MTSTSMPSEQRRTRLRVSDPSVALFEVRSNLSTIQWPTAQEIQKVSELLVEIRRVGIRSEAKGDYFRSGDLAYQIQEIIRATAELSKKSLRAGE